MVSKIIYILFMLEWSVLLMVPVVTENLYTSIQGMEALVELEEQLLEFLQIFIHSQHTKLTILTQKYEELVNERPMELNNDEYISNPIRAFTLIRRLVREWPILLNLIVEKFEIPKELLKLPSEQDMDSAVRGLARIQDVYTIRTRDLAEGQVPQFYGRSALSASDCMEMGHFNYYAASYKIASSWFNQALEKMSRGDRTANEDNAIVFLYLSKSLTGCTSSNQMANTNGLLQQLITANRNFVLGGYLSKDYKEVLSRNCSWVHEQIRTEEATKAMTREDTLRYNEMCSRPKTLPFRAELKCRYIHYNNPRLRIGPFKMEEFNVDPPLLMIHDAISDLEIEDMKSASHSTMGPCMTVHYDDGESRADNVRTCNVAWITDDITPTSKTLTERITDITNLSLEFSEVNQVANYGVGGEFLLHFDSFSNPLTEKNYLGDRIATVMFYLNDVQGGGCTVFPNLELCVEPHKGAALMWFNIDCNGNSLEPMLHGGCPVISGSKWVINRWIREAGQSSSICPVDGKFPKKYFYLNKV